jgi:hypothetical protein
MQEPVAAIVGKGRTHYRPDLALALTLTIAAVHIVLVWGETTLLGDGGRWRDEVERFIRGETLYRDFVWPFPPLALWVLGWIQRIWGDNTLVIFGACAILTLLIAVLYWQYCSTLLTDRITIAIVSVVGMTLAFGYAQNESDPLPAGMYTPAAPIGFLFLLFALCAWASDRSALAGIACGLASVTKQDFWLPAGVILIACVAKRHSRGWIAVLCASVVVLSVIAIIVIQSGWAVLPQILTGYGRVRLQAARHLPSWERVCAQFATSGFIAAVALLALRRWRLALLTLGVFVTLTGALYAGSGRVRAVYTLVIEHQLPWLVPFAFLIWSIRRGERDLAWLVGIVLAARIRRGFEYTEWYAFLLEIPIYALILRRRKAERAIPILAGTLAIVALFAYWRFGKGPLTSESRYQNREWVRTARGPVNWPSQDAHLYYAVKSALGDDRSPLYALNYTGGFTYYLARVNPSPSDETLIFAGRDKMQVVNAIRAARPVLLEQQDPYRVRVPKSASLTSWRLLTQPNYVETIARADFRLISTGCEKSSVENAEPAFWIYHCR